MHLSRLITATALAALPMLADHLSVPAGSKISVRTNQEINSETAQPGDVFAAEIASDVTSTDGRVVIPRGAPAKLTIREFDKGGVAGTRELELDLESVRVDRRNYFVGATADAGSSKEGLGKNKRTATYTGGGAALGALIGAIAGGGKGAVIGGLSGAAAGAAAQVLTRGDKVKVPAETVLNFRIENDLRLATR